MNRRSRVDVWPSILFGFCLWLTASAAFAHETVSFKNADGQRIDAIYIKADASASRAAPAVIMLHGCGGLFTKSGKMQSRERAWIDILSREGWTILLPDSFGSRGHGSICKIKDRPVRPERERPVDTAAALTWLAAQPGVDPARIALMGWSNGAMTALHTIRHGSKIAPPLGASDFATTVIFYPGCIALNKAYPNYRPRMPTLIQHGELDDWTLAKPCLDLVLRVRERDSAPPMFIDVYRGAYHGFDHPNSKPRAITTKHSGYKTGERTVHVGTHPEARALAIKRTLEWLRAHLNQ